MKRGQQCIPQDGGDNVLLLVGYLIRPADQRRIPLNSGIPPEWAPDSSASTTTTRLNCQRPASPTPGASGVVCETGKSRVGTMVGMRSALRTAISAAVSAPAAHPPERG